jgi:hypothetical protein
MQNGSASSRYVSECSVLTELWMGGSALMRIEAGVKALAPKNRGRLGVLRLDGALDGGDASIEIQSGVNAMATEKRRYLRAVVFEGKSVRKTERWQNPKRCQATALVG